MANTTTVHNWVVRGYCSSCEQYLWTNPGSPNVLCECGSAEIKNHVLVSGEEVISSSAFRAAVCADINVLSANLDLHQVPE